MLAANELAISGKARDRLVPKPYLMELLCNLLGRWGLRALMCTLISFPQDHVVATSR